MMCRTIENNISESTLSLGEEVGQEEAPDTGEVIGALPIAATAGAVIAGGISQAAKAARQKAAAKKKMAVKKIVQQQQKIAQLQQKLAATKIARQQQRIDQLQQKLNTTQQPQGLSAPPADPNAPAASLAPEPMAAPGNSEITAQLPLQLAELLPQLNQLVAQQQLLTELLPQLAQFLAQQPPPAAVEEPPADVTASEDDGDYVFDDAWLSDDAEEIEDDKQFEQEDALDFIVNTGTGALSGAATGANSGPVGTTIGALVGGLVGAAKTAQQQQKLAAVKVAQRGQKPSVASVNSDVPAPVAPLTPEPTAAPGASENTTQLLQKLAELLPQLTRSLAQQSPSATIEKPPAEVIDGEDYGERDAADAWLSDDEEFEDDEMGRLLLEEDEEFSDAPAFNEDSDDSESLLEWISTGEVTGDCPAEWLDEDTFEREGQAYAR